MEKQRSFERVDQKLARNRVIKQLEKTTSVKRSNFMRFSFCVKMKFYQFSFRQMFVRAILMVATMLQVCLVTNNGCQSQVF